MCLYHPRKSLSRKLKKDVSRCGALSRAHGHRHAGTWSGGGGGHGFVGGDNWAGPSKMTILSAISSLLFFKFHFMVLWILSFCLCFISHHIYQAQYLITTFAKDPDAVHLLVFIITGISRRALCSSLLALMWRSSQNLLPLRVVCSKRENEMCGPV